MKKLAFALLALFLSSCSAPLPGDNVMLRMSNDKIMYPTLEEFNPEFKECFIGGQVAFDTAFIKEYHASIERNKQMVTDYMSHDEVKEFINFVINDTAASFLVIYDSNRVSVEDNSDCYSLKMELIRSTFK